MSFGCWESNADIKQWMQTHNMGANFTLLNNYYMTRLLEIIGSASERGGVMNKTAMFWRPGAADTLTQSDIPDGTIFDVYGSFRGHDYGETISLTTAAGHKVVRSAGMYLDQLCDVDNWNAGRRRVFSQYVEFFSRALSKLSA